MGCNSSRAAAATAPAPSRQPTATSDANLLQSKPTSAELQSKVPSAGEAGDGEHRDVASASIGAESSSVPPAQVEVSAASQDPVSASVEPEGEQNPAEVQEKPEDAGEETQQKSDQAEPQLSVAMTLVPADARASADVDVDHVVVVPPVIVSPAPAQTFCTFCCAA
eukprot:TRINITY_DN14009_c0_g1_i1.p1 TRINITY_DN14009_c0_g1~~TRINITY_DN14009_c0_g1_i1.p1  ORF type:complete len:193 (+),score=43.09 TRINITY_DN14009_c0_g1_i1:83-580(+)